MISKNRSEQLSAITEPARQRPKGKFVPNPKVPLREQVREVMRFFHYSQRTEETYWQWFHRAPTPTPSQEGSQGG